MSNIQIGEISLFKDKVQNESNGMKSINLVVNQYIENLVNQNDDPRPLMAKNDNVSNE